MKKYKLEQKTLEVDLGSGEAKIDSPDNLTLEQILGGFGSSTHIMQEYLKEPITDAYDPRNPLIINIGFLTGSPVMTSRRTYMTSLSPLKTSKKGTPGIYYSTASGGMGPEIRKCGLDNIVITGSSEKPVYLLVDNQNGELKIELKDASALVGKKTSEKIEMLASEYENAHIASIGPAGENKVRYANVAFSTANQLRKKSKHMRFAGRGGMGAVMGSKNLHAIVIRGRKEKIPMYATLNKEEVKELNKEIGKGKKTLKYRESGTFFSNIPVLHLLSSSIINNFRTSSDKKSEKLFREVVEEEFSIKNKGCQGCGINCWKEIQQNGKCLGKLDYENGALLGPNLGSFDVKEILESINLTDELGLDAMSTGVVLGYIMDYNQRNDKKGLSFGDAKSVKEAIKKIGLGKDKLLAQGVKRISEKLGDEEYAMHCKGVELAAYLGNTNPGYAFAIAGMHTSMDTYNKAFFNEASNSVEEWAENIVKRGLNIIIYDMNGLCKFSKVDFKDVTKMLSEIYSVNIDEPELKRTAVKTYLLARDIDAGQGFTSEDDTLPKQCHKDLGTIIEHFNTKEFFEELKNLVYRKFDEIKEFL